MTITVSELRKAADFLATDGANNCRPEERDKLLSVAEYLRFVADQREEYQSRLAPPDPRMDKLKSALKHVWSARTARLAGRTG